MGRGLVNRHSALWVVTLVDASFAVSFPSNQEKSFYGCQSYKDGIGQTLGISPQHCHSRALFPGTDNTKVGFLLLLFHYGKREGGFYQIITFLVFVAGVTLREDTHTTFYRPLLVHVIDN